MFHTVLLLYFLYFIYASVPYIYFLVPYIFQVVPFSSETGATRQAVLYSSVGAATCMEVLANHAHSLVFCVFHFILSKSYLFPFSVIFHDFYNQHFTANLTTHHSGSGVVIYLERWRLLLSRYCVPCRGIVIPQCF